MESTIVFNKTFITSGDDAARMHGVLASPRLLSGMIAVELGDWHPHRYGSCVRNRSCHSSGCGTYVHVL